MTDERSQFEDPPVPVVTGAPDVIYLCVGDLEHDDSFGAIEYTGEVTWCADKQGNSDIKYVRADLAARAAPAITAEQKAEVLRLARRHLQRDLRDYLDKIGGPGAAPAQPQIVDAGVTLAGFMEGAVSAQLAERIKLTRWPLITGGMSKWRCVPDDEPEHPASEYAWATIDRIAP
jgi:hypothetical protein